MDEEELISRVNSYLSRPDRSFEATLERLYHEAAAVRAKYYNKQVVVLDDDEDDDVVALEDAQDVQEVETMVDTLNLEEKELFMDKMSAAQRRLAELEKREQQLQAQRIANLARLKSEAFRSSHANRYSYEGEEEQGAVVGVDDSSMKRRKKEKEKLLQMAQETKAYRDTHLKKSGLTISCPPVNLRPPFSEEEEEAYDTCMDRANSEVVLFERYNANVYGSQMQCYLPGTWLNDEIINQYLSLLMQRSRDLVANPVPGAPSLKCYFQSTYLYSKLMEGHKYDYKRVEKWTKRGFRKCDLFDMDIVLFPRNISNSHWTLCVAYMQHKRIEYFDSMGGMGEDCMRNVARYLADEALAKKKMTLNIDEWEFHSHGGNVPQQNNCNDCGAFTSVFCNYLSMGQALNFSSGDMTYFRKRMCVDVYQGKASWIPSS